MTTEGQDDPLEGDGPGRRGSNPTPGGSPSNPKLLEQRTALLLKARKVLTAEVQKRQRAELRSALESAVVRVLTSSPSFREALPSLVKAITLGAGWDASEYWIFDPEEQSLRWGGSFAREGSGLDRLREVSKGAVLSAGKGFPWRVWARGQPVWGHPIGDDVPGPRGAFLRKAGVATAVSIAFHGGEGTSGILTLYARDDRPHQPETLEYLSKVLHQMTRLGGWRWGEGSQTDLESRVRDFIEAYPLPAFFMDVHGRIRFSSDSARKILGERIVGEAVMVRDLPRLLPLFIAETNEPYPLDKLPFLRALQGESAYADDLEVRRDGRSLFLEAWASPLRASGGQISFAIGVVINTTAVRRQRKELEQARELAQAADRAKSDFVSRMSHEIRTPLNAILGSVDLLWDTPLTQDQQEYVRLCREAGQGLMSLISNILDLSRVEAGKLELAETPFSLEEFVERTMELVSLRAHQKGIELTSYVEPGVPERIVADPVRLRQVLVNLLGNALKFTEKGHISVRVRHDPGAVEAGHLLFCVQDTGIGIPADRLDAVFERFVQASASTAAEYGGSGLGLTISKHLVEMMGGRIWVESEVGQGSKFNFTIHAKVAEGSPMRRAIPGLKGVRVLIVDGSEADRQLLHGLLESEASVVNLAESTKAALDELTRSKEAGTPYQLVLLADRLADGPSWSVAKALADQGVAGQVVFLSSPAAARDNAPRLKEMGIVNQLVKPVDRGALLPSISTALQAAKVLPKPERRTVRAAPVAAPDLKGLRLLVAEDSEDNRFLLLRFLRNTACRIDVAENGKVALDKFQRGEYDLVLMDLQMPFMDGYTATKSIREWEKRRGVAPTPIIALSAYAIKEEIEKSLAAGCDAHITKPIDKAKLFEILGNYAKKAEA